ncbi:MAG: class I SAM-dependent methyltransferase [Actinomycetota bacterium]|nr:class I SAM-dependent methyltransferase [Actinomycetota bacterium]
MAGTCKICGSRTTELRCQPSKIIYHVCSNCQYICKDDAFLVSDIEQRQRYQQHNNSLGNPGYRAYFNDFIQAAVIPFCNGKNGLDFGSGPSPVLALILEEKYGFMMDTYDLFFAPFKIYEDKKYDLVTATEVVEHLANPLKYFRLFKTLLKQDGLLSVMTQFHPSASSKFLKWYYIRDITHISFYTLDTMKHIAEILGLIILYTDNQKYISFKTS